MIVNKRLLYSVRLLFFVLSTVLSLVFCTSRFHAKFAADFRTHFSTMTSTNDDSSSIITPLQIQQEYWDTLIPIQLSLAPTSVSSPTLPPAIHVLVSRCNYLHISLEAAVRRFHPFAPMISLTRLSIKEPEFGEEEEEEVEHDQTTASSGSETKPAKGRLSNVTTQEKQPYPVCWFEDEETKLPLRWHLFTGVLYDLLQHKKQCLPWRIRLHFTNYPSSQLLPLEEKHVLSSIQFIYKNSLKQAIALLTGSSKAAMNLITKETHGVLWEAIQNGNCTLYHRVKLPEAESCIPVRLLVDRTSPPIQRRVERSETQTLRELLVAWHPNVASEDAAMCTVCGLEPASLDVPLHILYRHCFAPDRFLYIVLTP